MTETRYRPFVPTDTTAMFEVFLRSANHLLHRHHLPPMADTDDPASIEAEWENNRSIWDHFQRSGALCFVAEQQGRVVGYARSILRHQVRQLTEFFILPEMQSGGLGRELLARAFPADDSQNRVVIATDDARAQARYMKAGLFPNFPICYFLRPEPRQQKVDTDLSVRPLDVSPETLAALIRIDQQVIGYPREIDHRWLIHDSHRSGFAFRRDGQIVAYAYVGQRCGPMAALHASDFPAILRFGENFVAENALPFDFLMPLINREAIRHMLSHSAKIESQFIVHFMSARPLGRYENYIFTAPDFMT